MTDRAQPTITIALTQPVMLELARMARESKITEGELIQRAIESLLRARRGAEIPRYARRLGPIAIAGDGPSAA